MVVFARPLPAAPFSALALFHRTAPPPNLVIPNARLCLSGGGICSCLSPPPCLPASLPPCLPASLRPSSSPTPPHRHTPNTVILHSASRYARNSQPVQEFHTLIQNSLKFGDPSNPPKSHNPQSLSLPCAAWQHPCLFSLIECGKMSGRRSRAPSRNSSFRLPWAS